MALVVWLGLVSSRPLAHPEPSLHHSPPRLHLNAFRGEPAISEFVWHFTSTHNSSQDFATSMGSGLHQDIILASPWPWVAHPVSGLPRATGRPIQTRFRYGSGTYKFLNLATQE